MTQLPIKVTKGTGKTVVLLHGLGNNHKSWTYVLRALNYHKIHVIVPDLLGFGDAPKPDGDYTVRDHAQAVIKTLETQGLEHAMMVGHSMGCLVAIEVALERPDLVDQLILLGAPLYKTIPRRHWWRQAFHLENVYFSLFSFLKQHPDMTIAAAKSAEAFLPLIHGMEITEQTWVPFRRSLTNSIMQTKSFNDTRNLRVPTLFVCGLLDVFASRANVKKAVRHNRKYARVKTVLGPHEITPLQGKKIARIMERRATH